MKVLEEPGTSTGDGPRRETAGPIGGCRSYSVTNAPDHFADDVEG